MVYEKSCGAVVFTRIGDEIKYLLVANLEGIWGFPKGHVEENEAEEETALREVYEETNLKIKLIDGFRTTDEHFIPTKKNTIKQITYFLGTFESQEIIYQKDELSACCLVNYAEAVSLFQFESSKRILREANDWLNSHTNGRSYALNRIEQVREVVDGIILNMEDDEERRCAYVHLYGVQLACSLLSLKRKANAELAIIAGLLHDIYSYANMDSSDHAHKGAEMARCILKKLSSFEESEIDLICSAIYNHSDKSTVHSALDEILKDADVMQHVLYNPLKDVKQHEQQRLDSLKMEFNF